MDDQTTLTEKPKRKVGSHFFSLSTRSLITLLVVVTACIMSYQGKAIEEPLKVLVVSIVSFYFGQNLRPATQQ
jgi:hypothetical protein